MNEDLLVKEVTLVIEGMSDDESRKNIGTALGGMQGITKAEIGDGTVRLTYTQHVLTLTEIKKGIETAGFTVKPGGSENRSRNPFRRYIERLAESNKKNFGTGSLDCCNLRK